MPKWFDTASPELAQWALSQPVFFIATSPPSRSTFLPASSYEDHINVSPKGLPSLSVLSLSPKTKLAYIDRTGSGGETISHLYDNGRATVMFCSFGSAPRIMRWFCTVDRIVENGDKGFADAVRMAQRARRRGLRGVFDGAPPAEGEDKAEKPEQGNDGDGDSTYVEEGGFEEGVMPPAARAVIILTAFQVQTSCGYGVPMLRPELWNSANPNFGDHSPSSTGGYEGIQKKPSEITCFTARPTLNNAAAKLENGGKVTAYQAEWNARSLDGLPGLRAARRARGEKMLWVGDAWWVARRTLRGEQFGILFGFVLGALAMLLVNLFVLDGERFDMLGLKAGWSMPELKVGGDW